VCFSPEYLSETFSILRRIERDLIKKICVGLYIKYPLFLTVVAQLFEGLRYKPEGVGFGS